jgi:hypothetical protein
LFLETFLDSSLMVASAFFNPNDIIV